MAVDPEKGPADGWTWVDTPSTQQAPPPQPEPNSSSALGVGADIAKGFVKSAGRTVQAIPGVAAATDWGYGLHKGASEAAMQPTNSAQKLGGYAEDAIEWGVPALESFKVAAAAKAGATVGRSAAGQFTKLPLVQQTVNQALDVVLRAGTAAKTELLSGHVTPEKVGFAVAKYGKHIVAGVLGLEAARKFGLLP